MFIFSCPKAMHVCCNRPEGHNKVGKTSSFRSGPGPCSYKNIGPSRQPAPLLLSCRKPGRRSRAPSIHLLLLLLTSSPAENLGRERWRGAGGEGSAESLTGSTMIMTPWEDLFFVINNLLLGEEPVSKDIWFLRHVIEECRFLKWSSVSLHVG